MIRESKNAQHGHQERLKRCCVSIQVRFGKIPKVREREFVGFVEVLTVVFVVLKLCGKIDWSWWLVLLPEIIAVVIYISLFVYNAVLKASIRKGFEDLRK